jgi:Transposase DDE domain
LSSKDFEKVVLNLDKPKTVFVTTFIAQVSHLEGIRTFAIVMNADSWEKATDIDYFITNVESSIATAEWIVETYSQRNWIEVFYREAKGWLGLKEYQVRDKKSLLKHFVLVFCAYSFILWHKLTGGLQRRWANKLPTQLEFNSSWKAAVHSAPLNTFIEALEAFRTAMSFRFFDWLTQNRDVFTAYKASLGYVWA